MSDTLPAAADRQPANLTLREAAEYLRVSQGHLSDLCKSGKLPCFRVGRRVLIQRVRLDEWIANGGVA